MATATKKTKKQEENAHASAVIATGGKQYIVRVGDIVSVEKLDGLFTAGDTISFDKVLLVQQGDIVTVGNPTVQNAQVTAEFIAQGKGTKIDVIKYKAKSRYFKKRGHRQPYMKFKISEIK